MSKKKEKRHKGKEKERLHRPYRQPPCKKCPALEGGVCDCARKKLGKSH